MKKQPKIPKFKNEEEEFEFFSRLDLSEHFEPSDFKKVHFPNLQPTSQKISMRMPTYLLARIKEKANAIGMPYQALIREAILDKLGKAQ